MSMWMRYCCKKIHHTYSGLQWDIRTSIFAQRLTDCESRDFYERDTTWQGMFERDWAMAHGKDKFQRMLETVLGSGASAVDVPTVKEGMRKLYRGMLRVFDYYAAVGSGDTIFNIHLNEWVQVSVFVCAGVPVRSPNK